MKLTCKYGTNITKVVEVKPTDPLYILLEKLKISDKSSKFIYNGITRDIASILTFQDIGLTSDVRLAIINQGISG